MNNRVVTFLTAFISLCVTYFIAYIFGDFLISLAIVLPILFSIVIGLQVKMIRLLQKK